MSAPVTRAKAQLWLAAFAGFYRPGVEEVRTLDPVSKFLYAARSIILVISAQAAIIAGLVARRLYILGLAAGALWPAVRL